MEEITNSMTKTNVWFIGALIGSIISYIFIINLFVGIIFGALIGLIFTTVSTAMGYTFITSEPHSAKTYNDKHSSDCCHDDWD